MTKVAIFVDAGYLFAQGSVAIAGSKQNRTNVRLNVPEVLAALSDLASKNCPNVRLLRTYWYDAPPKGGRSLDHIKLATSDYVKLRLGTLNSQGEQKGVDSLIVTDLIELARNRSISEAILLSGDEDVRIGVQIAQNYGVTVHLLGITPARGSQSNSLREEADTNTEWEADAVKRMLTIIQTSSLVDVSTKNTTYSKPSIKLPSASDDLVSTVVLSILAEDMSGSLKAEVQDFWQQGKKGLPTSIDRRFLARLRESFARNLTEDEKRAARIKFKSHIEQI
jgi:uncharacterized LabA/DUF88 family protein